MSRLEENIHLLFPVGSSLMKVSTQTMEIVRENSEHARNRKEFLEFSRNFVELQSSKSSAKLFKLIEVILPEVSKSFGITAKIWEFFQTIKSHEVGITSRNDCREDLANMYEVEEREFVWLELFWFW